MVLVRTPGEYIQPSNWWQCWTGGSLSHINLCWDRNKNCREHEATWKWVEYITVIADIDN